MSADRFFRHFVDDPFSVDRKRSAGLRLSQSSRRKDAFWIDQFNQFIWRWPWHHERLGLCTKIGLFLFVFFFLIFFVFCSSTNLTRFLFILIQFNCCGVVENNQDNKKTFGYSAWLLNNRFRDPSSGQSANSQPAPWSCCKSNAGKGQLPDENNRPGCATGYPQTVHQDVCLFILIFLK